MTASSDSAVAITRKSTQAFLGALARMSLETISKAIAKDDSTSSRVRSGEARLTVGELCDLIDAAGLKLVALDRVCVDRKKYEALATIAAAAMSDPESAKKLVWAARDRELTDPVVKAAFADLDAALKVHWAAQGLREEIKGEAR